MFKDLSLSIPIFFLIVLSVVILNSIAHNVFPGYFIYITLAIFTFWLFSQIDFEVLSIFSAHFYVFSIILLLLTLAIGRITNGTIRWIPIGSFTLQPSEIVRPLLLVFFANYLTKEKVSIGRFFWALGYLMLPFVLILIQPSFSVAIIIVIGFLGILLASNFNKKIIIPSLLVVPLILLLLFKIMAPYQRARLASFLNPASEPLGAGYNSIQSTIAAGAGEFVGRGLGRGVQTQLSFLPEKQTDFIFAAVSEELGFVGSSLMLAATFMILFRLTKFMENSVSPGARAYLSGFFITYLIQVFIHVGMNMGIFPVTGLPFPLVSAGGSSFLSTMVGLGIAVGTYRK